MGLFRPREIVRSSRCQEDVRARTPKEMIGCGLASGKLYPKENFLDLVLSDLTRGVKATPMTSILVSKKLLRGTDLEELRKQ